MPPSAVSRAPLSPISYLRRSALVWRRQPAVRFGDRTVTYGELLDRCERAAGALRELGVGPGARVAALLPNVPELLELHFAVPGSGAVLVPVNVRLAAPEVRYIVEHSGAHCIVVHETLLDVARAAVAELRQPPAVVVAGADWEARVGRARPVGLGCEDEDALLSINYTSGTTGAPKGAMYDHRGAYLHALGVIAETGLSVRSRYLWTLPMFHCNGWAYTWAVTAAGATHVCLDAIDVARVWRLLREEGITHLCAAPTVVTMLAEAPEAAPLEQAVRVFVGGAPPSPALLERAEALGFEMTHLYGLTETYGPLAVCARQPGWDGLPRAEQARLVARQGVGTVVTEPLRVVDDALRDVPADGATVGELVMRGNNVMRGYYRDEQGTAAAFAGGWLHSGDLAVMHPDGYVELRDRAKDVVISGGENVSTIEVEQALAAHPDVVEAAVVGVPDERWGERLRAFVTLRAGAPEDVDALRAFVRERLAGFKVPREVLFCGALPKTATGKVQKFVLREGWPPAATTDQEDDE